MNKHYLLFLFGVSVWIILTFSFKSNIFNTASNYFDYFQYDSESLVVGRLMLSERDGVTAHAGFLGKVKPVPPNEDPFWFQYESYCKKNGFNDYEAYYSQPGMQAFFYGIFCKITGVTGERALTFFYWLISLFTAMIFTLFLMWVQVRWGLVTAVFTFITILFSQWVIYFGHNLFWVLGIFYLPFVASLWFLQCAESRIKRPLLMTFLLVFSTMLLKCLFTGFEYITTTSIMSVVPWVFFGIMHKWNLKSFLSRFFSVSAGIISAVSITILWLSIQLSFVKGSLSEGFKYILYSLNKRTYSAGNASIDSSFKESLDSNVFDVLAAYWNGTAVDLSHWFDNPFMQYFSKISFGTCIIIFLVISFIVVTSNSIKSFPAFRRQQIALIITLWVSLLAPLSWFIIFKGHSYVHTHMNHIVWHMPFMLLGAVLTGSTVYFFVRNLFQQKSKLKVIPLNEIDQPTRKQKNTRINILYCSLGVIFLILVRLFIFEPVRVSGSSMEKALSDGDWIIVNKLYYGASSPQSLSEIPLFNVLTWVRKIREWDENSNWVKFRLPGLTDIQRNDVIVCRLLDSKTQVVKRVHGLPGDLVELREGKIWINNSSVEELPSIIPGSKIDSIVFHSEGNIQILKEDKPVSIPPDSYFVLGDNQDNSIDSRNYGWIKKEQVIGKSSIIIFSDNKKTQ